MSVKGVTSLALHWENAPSNISAMFFNAKENCTYLIQTSKLYKYKNRKLMESMPVDVRSEFSF